jgi:hypothetical protein
MVSFTPRPLYSQDTQPGTLWIGGWVGSTAGLDLLDKEKTYLFYLEYTYNFSSVEPLA